MATPRSHKKLDTATARAKLPPRKAPYWVQLRPTIHLGYRRNIGDVGTWSVKVGTPGSNKAWIKRIALADDVEAARPPEILNYTLAIDEAMKLARPQEAADVTIEGERPLTVHEALIKYKADLIRRGGNPINATSVIFNIGALKNVVVALVKTRDLEDWRDALVTAGKLQPSSINRLMNSLRAALELAARKDKRITNVGVFKGGLEKLQDANVARNKILKDEEVCSVVAASHEQDHKVGIFMQTMADTGARPSQIGRLEVRDLIILDPKRPKLMMPKSGKGGKTDRAKRKATRYPVPITTELAATLKREAAGRPMNAPLLVQMDGRPWGNDPYRYYRWVFGDAVADIDPEITAYALRHSSIVRMLLANVPIRIVAAKHDTSVQQIEKTYSRDILHHSDEIERRALLDVSPRKGKKVIAMVR